MSDLEEIETVPEIDDFIRRKIDPRWPNSIKFGSRWLQTSYFAYFRVCDFPIRLKNQQPPARRLADFL